MLVPPQDDLLAVIRDALPRLEENSILAITSKVVSIWQGRCIPKEKFPDKDELVKKEADKYLSRDVVPQKWIMHTIKNNLFIPTAGIDESNANGYYVLWPKNPQDTARALYDWARETYKIKNIGIIITDSHTIPLRRGTLGISLAHFGFIPVKDYRKETDLFGRPFAMTLLDIADGLAAAAVVAMGEGKESTPLALIRDIPFVEFVETPPPETSDTSLEIPEKEDLYYPFLSSVPWEKGEGGV
ncbi:MAG: hypothetical protein G01um101433_389 [Parcubacteria group bacterium Gr01-1014_33]|nr:MAG: hypothetical protein G01um101433_389 [Parcubacteria group bacterium Gr01-1014_33]